MYVNTNYYILVIHYNVDKLKEIYLRFSIPTIARFGFIDNHQVSSYVSHVMLFIKL